MDYNSTYEQEIDLKDLMFAVLYKWKLIIATAVIMAVALGGYKMVGSWKSTTDSVAAAAAQEKYNLEQEAYEEALATYERSIENINAAIAEYGEYQESSVLMQMNPYDVWEGRADLYISVDSGIVSEILYQNGGYTEAVLQAYSSLLTGDMDELAQSMDMDLKYLNELISVSVEADFENKASSNIENNVEINLEGPKKILTIRAKHSDADKAEATLDAIVAKIETLQPQITEMIGKHSVELLNREVRSNVDLELAETQQKQEQKLTELNKLLTEKQKQLTELKAPSKPDFSMTSVIKSGIKFAILGGVAGAFLVVFAICVIFLMTDKVYSSKELKNRCRVKILGALPVHSGKKMCAIDAWLNRLEGRVFEQDEKLNYGLLAANIQNYTADMKTLLVTGTVGADAIASVAEKLKAEMSGVQVISGGSMLKEMETLKKLPGCDGVVLVEQSHVSRYSEIELEMEKARDLDKTIVGCIVIG